MFFTFTQVPPTLLSAECNSRVIGRFQQAQDVNALWHPLHDHPVEDCERRMNWYCDICRAKGDGAQRFRCTAGCDFDFCVSCMSSSPSIVPLQHQPDPLVEREVLVVSVPDQATPLELSLSEVRPHIPRVASAQQSKGSQEKEKSVTEELVRIVCWFF